jgi:hypothetical protein
VISGLMRGGCLYGDIRAVRIWMLDAYDMIMDIGDMWGYIFIVVAE